MKWGLTVCFHLHSKLFMSFSEIPGNSFAVCFSIYKLSCYYWVDSRNFICILHFRASNMKWGLFWSAFFLFFFKATEHLEPGLFVVVVFPINPSMLFSWALFYLDEELDCSILEMEHAIIFPSGVFTNISGLSSKLVQTRALRALFICCSYSW